MTHNIIIKEQYDYRPTNYGGFPKSFSKISGCHIYNNPTPEVFEKDLGIPLRKIITFLKVFLRKQNGGEGIFLIELDQSKFQIIVNGGLYRNQEMRLGVPFYVTEEDSCPGSIILKDFIFDLSEEIRSNYDFKLDIHFIVKIEPYPEEKKKEDEREKGEYGEEENEILNQRFADYLHN